MSTAREAEVKELSQWIDSLVKTQEVKKPPPVEEPEEADALVMIATSVVCETCHEHHISNSHVMKRVPRKNGTVLYKPVIGPAPKGLPHVVEWAFESNSQCWRCWDLAERLLDPTANLALAPDKLDFEPGPVINREEPQNE